MLERGASRLRYTSSKRQVTRMVFEPALESLAASGESLFGPRSFREYVSEHGIDGRVRTAQHISIDSLAAVPSELEAADVMVLRMGSAPDATGTAFVLLEAPKGVEQFFLEDEALFSDVEPARFESPVPADQLRSFDLLPSLSETSLVNLGLASGVMSEALALDTSRALLPPATGQSTFTFEVRPASHCHDPVTHRNGQVEIDTLLTERRDGTPTLFVIEAKTGPRASLASHKLVYPLLAVAPAVGLEVEIVPVYLRCRALEDVVRFDIAECEFPDPRERLAGVDELAVERTRVVELERSQFR